MNKTFEKILICVTFFLSPILIASLVLFLSGCGAEPMKTMNSDNPKVKVELISSFTAKNGSTVEIYRINDNNDRIFYFASEKDSKTIAQEVRQGKTRILVAQKSLEKSESVKQTTKMDDAQKAFIYTKENGLVEINGPLQIIVNQE